MEISRRTAILAINYPPEPNGNAPYAGSLAVGLMGRGHEVHAFVTHPHYPAWKVKEGYGEWTRDEVLEGVRVRRFRHYVPNPPRGFRRLVSELSFGVRLFFRPNVKADVYVALSPALFATWVALLRPLTKPLIVWVQDIYTLGLAEIGEGGRATATVTRWVESRVLKRADRIVVIHERFKERLVELYGLDPDRIVVMRNWTYIEAAPAPDGRSVREQLNWGEETVVLYAGNFGAKQGLENVIKAAQLAQQQGADIRFVLLGGGSEETHLKEMAGRLAAASAEKGDKEARIEFHGPLPPLQFSAVLRVADILLVSEKPGVAESSVPSKLASYFDAARPIIAVADPNGITADELDRAGAGVVVPAGKPQALLDAAIALGQDPARSALYGQNGRSYRETILDMDHALDRWNSLIEEVVVERARVDAAHHGG